MHSTIEADVAGSATGSATGSAAGSAAGSATGRVVRSWYDAWQSVPDKRHRRGRRYEAGLVLTLLLLAKLAGESAMAAIAQWVRERQSLLAQWLPLTHTPCANTYRNICASIDATALLQVVAGVLGAAEASALLQPAPVRHLACDGKAERGSYRLTAQGVQPAQELFGIYDTTSGCMEVLLPIAGKGFEAKAFKEWLAQQTGRQTTGQETTGQQTRKGACAGCLLTADALHTQTAVCKAIRKADADYLLVAKRNQRGLREDIGYLFSQQPDFWFPERTARQVNVGHGRIEVRTMRASNELNDYLADRWPGVQQVFQVERTITRRSRQGTQTTHERVYGLTSLPADRASPAQLLMSLRAHWRIENRNHWRRDATLGEDRLQLACKPAALVMAVLNCLILALFDRMHCTNCRQAMRTFDAHPEQALALLRSPP